MNSRRSTTNCWTRTNPWKKTTRKSPRSLTNSSNKSTSCWTIWDCTTMQGSSILLKSTGKMWKTLRRTRQGWYANYKKKLHKSTENKKKTSSLFSVSPPNNSNWPKITNKRWLNSSSAKPKSRSDSNNPLKNNKNTVSRSCGSRTSSSTCASNFKKRTPLYLSNKALLTSTTGWGSCICSSGRSWWRIIEMVWRI